MNKYTDCYMSSSHKGCKTDRKAGYDKIGGLMTSLFSRTFMLDVNRGAQPGASVYQPYR